MFRKFLIVELFVIGLITILFNFVIYFSLVGKLPEKKNVSVMVLGAFLLGVSIHLFFEVIGGNHRWCRLLLDKKLE